MSPRLNERLKLLRESPTRRIDALREKLAREGRDVILLSAGQPSIPPPRWVREWLAERLLEESMRLYGYTPSPGIAGLREAIAEDIRLLGGPSIDAEQVIVTAGGQEAMFTVLASILEPGDEVVVTDPMYFGYWPLLSYFGAKPVVVETSLEQDYQPDPNAVGEVVRKGRTKAIIVVTPDNPTGRILDEKVGKALAEIVVDNNLWLVVDEAYKTLIYEGEHVWLYKYAPENTISVNTFSKDPGIPGWRLGYIYGPPSAIEKMRLLSEELVYCPPSIAQYMVMYYLSDPKKRLEHIEYVRSVYRRKRDTVLKAVDRYLAGARYAKPRGSMFVLVDLRERLEPARLDSEVFAEKLLVEKSVALVPGTYFGKTTRYALRISFVIESEERLREGVRRIGELLESI